MQYCHECRRTVDHGLDGCPEYNAKQRHKELIAEERKTREEQRRTRQAMERREAAEEDRARKGELLRRAQDKHSEYLHLIDRALRRTRAVATEDPPLHYLFVLQLRRRMEEFEVTNLDPEERHIAGEVADRIEKRLRSVRKRIPDTADELDDWVDTVRAEHEVEQRVKVACAALVQYREENSLASQAMPRSSADGRQAMDRIQEQLVQWRATAPPRPPDGVLTLALAWKLNGRWFPRATTFEAIATTGRQAHAAAVRRWPQGNWGAVGFPAGKAMLQSTILILLMAAGAWYFLPGPEVAVAGVVIALFTGGFGVIRFVQEGLARQTVTDAVEHYEAWAKEIKKLDGELAALKDLTEAFSEVEEFRSRTADLRRWEAEHPALREAVLDAVVARNDVNDDGGDGSFEGEDD